MSLSTDLRRLAACLLVTLIGTLVSVPAASAQQGGGGTRGAGGSVNGDDLDLAPLDLVIAVESLDGSVATADSSTKSQTTLAGDVLFEFNRADLTAAATATLDQVADNIKANAKGPVQIDGYTDGVGDDAYNQDLSRNRAASVGAALQTRLAGNSTELRPVGHGKNDPVAPDANPDGSDNPAGRAKNRRVTVSFPK